MCYRKFDELGNAFSAIELVAAKDGHVPVLLRALFARNRCCGLACSAIVFKFATEFVATICVSGIMRGYTVSGRQQPRIHSCRLRYALDLSFFRGYRPCFEVCFVTVFRYKTYLRQALGEFSGSARCKVAVRVTDQIQRCAVCPHRT